MRIYVTGDPHGAGEGKSKFQRFRDGDYTADDYVIVCGDWSFVYYSTPEKENQLDIRDLAFLEQCKCTFIVVGGNHEAYPAIESLYPISEFRGAKARYVRPNCIWIERGEVFELGGRTFWCFAGAQSHDRGPGSDARGARARQWWEHEQATDEEQEYALSTLSDPDYVITHDIPYSVAQKLFEAGRIFEVKEKNRTSEFLDEVYSRIPDKTWWFCGHYHIDAVDDAGTRVRELYRRFLELDLENGGIKPEWAFKKKDPRCKRLAGATEQ